MCARGEMCTHSPVLACASALARAGIALAAAAAVVDKTRVQAQVLVIF